MGTRPFKETWEQSANGIDEALQGEGADPSGSIVQTGLRVPTLATSDVNNRYLFMLSSFEVAEGVQKVIVGFRQMATLLVGVATNPQGGTRFIEQEITSPFWHFPDGNISWSLRYIEPKLANRLVQTTGPIESAADTGPVQSIGFIYSNGPSLLYDIGTVIPTDFYPTLTKYVAPNLGRPYGTPIGDLGTFHDLRAFWRADTALDSLYIPCTQPGTYAFFASVKQTNPDTRPNYLPPNPFFPQGLPPEEQFLLNFPNAIYGKVGGSLIVEEMPVT